MEKDFYNEKLTLLADEALKQIEDMGYDTEMKEDELRLFKIWDCIFGKESVCKNSLKWTGGIFYAIENC